MSRGLPAKLLLIAIVVFGALSVAAKGCVTPPGIPHRLGIGLMNSPAELGWMTSSGIPFDYRYQYLTGGVNTDSGWADWNSPRGSFVDNYLNDSGANGYIPVLTYYQIVASAPDPWSEDVMVKLQNDATMNAYFGEWSMLMQKAGAYGRPVIVHVEPDMWAYMEQSYGTNAAAAPVSVASSGFGEVAGFDDNASGFAKALVHLRDAYAPNVVLAWHVSAWATGVDLKLNDADPYAIAGEISSFYRSLGAPFDLLFFDPSDRDAGFYEVSAATAAPTGGTTTTSSASATSSAPWSTRRAGRRCSGRCRSEIRSTRAWTIVGGTTRTTASSTGSATGSTCRSSSTTGSLASSSARARTAARCTTTRPATASRTHRR